MTGIITAATVSVLARACYAGYLNNWTVPELELVSRPLNTQFRKTAKFMPTTASHLLHLAPSHGRMGLPNSTDTVLRRK